MPEVQAADAGPQALRAPYGPGNCPTPKKRSFENEREAELVLNIFRGRRRSGKFPTRVYECPCGKWHCTSKPKRRGEQH